MNVTARSIDQVEAERQRDVSRRIVRIAHESFKHDQVLAPLTGRRIRERLDLAVKTFREMTDDNGMGYSQVKALDFLPLALRSHLDGIPVDWPSATQGWYAESARIIPGTDVKL